MLRRTFLKLAGVTVALPTLPKPKASKYVYHEDGIVSAGTIPDWQSNGVKYCGCKWKLYHAPLVEKRVLYGDITV